MNPSIQYVHTADGVAIAYWALNEGLPLVYAPIIPFSHIQLEWQIPQCRRWYEQLAGHRQLIRYDARGCGLSERDVSDFSLDGLVLDLEAVADGLHLDNFALFASSDASMMAIAYAARHPDRVSHLILWSAWARREDVSRSAQARSLRAVLEQDWTIYTETVARVLMGWAAEGPAREFAAFYRACTSADAVRALAASAYETDVSALLPQIRCPTLVVHRSHIPGVGLPVVRDLAARIPNARLALLEGLSPLPFLEDTQAVVRAIQVFLGEEPEDDAAAPDVAGRAIASAPVTILFTDMQSSTAMTQRLGDARAQDVLHVHNSIVRAALKRLDGSEVKHTGDGIMASFASATRGLECAVAIQRALATHNASAPDGAIHVRIGLNAGEPVAEESDLFGTAVQIAARVCEHAEPDQILVSNVVRELASGKGFLFSDRGDSVLRGFEDPVRLFEVRWSPGD
ncbi:MAG: adenylate/guanylate cyclase domain-containing protein [Dehalococcoidia bacterium]|nr:adenylate/guanylate cyclase domain-containing protein [Dehalococcoidia bacterium]